MCEYKCLKVFTLPNGEVKTLKDRGADCSICTENENVSLSKKDKRFYNPN